MPNTEKVINNLKKNNFDVIKLDNKAQVIDTIASLIPKNSTVSWGGSMTLNECGVIDFVKNGDYKIFDRDQAGVDRFAVMKQAAECDYYLCSSNAITEDGELYNVDGLGNRVAALTFGPDKVIVVAGTNKIVKDVRQAILRVKTISAPKNASRLNCDTYCNKKGKCVSLLIDDPEMTNGCDSPSRLCCEYSVIGYQRRKRITIILVNEVLGY